MRIGGLLLVTLALGMGLLAGCGQKASPTASASEEQLYTCGMHPRVIQNKPGNCPICGMTLTPVRKGASLEIDSVTSQNMDLRLGVVGAGPVRRTIRTVGVIDFDETTLADVTTKFKGWIEKLYVDTTGQQVHRGEPLFEIYSPELYSAQVEYLMALKQNNGSGANPQLLKTSALSKLKYFDISDEQVAEIEKKGEARKSLRINAPRDGIVVEKMAVEGQMVEAGMKLYRLADLGTVWVQSQIYEQDLEFIHLGQEATVSLAYMQDRKFRGRVTYIYPTVDDKTRTAKVRMEFHNPGYFLKPGMFATVQLAAEVAASAVLVPEMAVLRSGERNTVFVALEGGKFEPRTVVLGARTDNHSYQVLSGLKEGERIVVSGQFMLDSESQLQEAIQKMSLPGKSEEVTEHAIPKGAHERISTGAHASTEADGTTVYLCPMPEHVSLEYEHPGKCPLCGMTLVPVTRGTLARIQPGGKVEYYTCPMPEHSDVRADKPGKCPRCTMTLIPVMVREARSAAQTEENAKAVSQEPLPKLYTCPMAEHADVVSDKPGECSKCEMKLVETGKVAHGKISEGHWREQHAVSH